MCRRLFCSVLDDLATHLRPGNEWDIVHLAGWRDRRLDLPDPDPVEANPMRDRFPRALSNDAKTNHANCKQKFSNETVGTVGAKREQTKSLP